MVDGGVQASGGEGIVLFHQQFGAFGEGGPVLVGPPVLQAAVTVILGTLVVETMADLVPNNGPNATVVGSVIGPASKNGGCKIAAGKTISFITGLK